MTLRTELLECAFTRCRTWWNYDGMTSPFGRLYYVVEGEARVRQKGCDYELRPNTLTAVPAHTTADLHCDDYMDLYWLHYNAGFRSGADFFEYLPCPLQIDPCPRREITAAFIRYIGLSVENTPGALLERDGLLRTLLARFYQRADPRDIARAQRKQERFGPILAFIDDHLDEALDNRRLAACIGLHPTYFANLFSRDIGVSPHRYVLRRRVERARELLWHGDDKLDTIAQSVGFSDGFHLSKVFTKLTELSPRAFRAQRRDVL